MADPRGHIVICTCEDTMPVHEATVRKACAGSQVTSARHLCRAEIDKSGLAAKDARSPEPARRNRPFLRKSLPRSAGLHPATSTSAIRRLVAPPPPSDGLDQEGGFLAAAAEPSRQFFVTWERSVVSSTGGERALDAGHQ